jgi:hypothetical protein
LRTALCGSEPAGNSGSAPCRMLMASLTFAIAPACDPGEPEGTEIGDDPIGGCPESEGGIGAGKGVIPSLETQRSTCDRVSGGDEPSWKILQVAGEALVQSP